MHAHLMEATSADNFTRSLGSNRLDLCLLVLHELEQNYPAATIVHTLFTQARANYSNSAQCRFVSGQSSSTADDHSDSIEPASQVSNQSGPLNDSFYFGPMTDFMDPWTSDLYIPTSRIFRSCTNGCSRLFSDEYNLNSVVNNEQWEGMFPDASQHT